MIKIPHMISSNFRLVTNKIEIKSQHIYSKAKSSYYKDKTKGINTICLFIGYPRSGHSLVGSLIDAHKNCIIANELDILKLVNSNFSRDQMYYLLLRNSENYSKKGRTQTGYKYDIPNQWQGRADHLSILGDKKGGMTTQRLSRNPMLLAKMNRIFGVPIKFIHVVRNPFDNISTMADRTNSTILKETLHYFGLCLKNSFIMDLAGPSSVLSVRHEDLIAAPEKALDRMISFLGLQADPDYLHDCGEIIYRSPNKSRHKHEWRQEEKDLVLRHCAKFNFLDEYTFDN